MFGIDFASLLAQKYALLQQERNADTTRANAYGLSSAAGANLDNTKAGLLPAESAANIAEQQARTAGTIATNQYIGPLALSQIGLQKKQGGYYGAAANNYNSEAAGVNNYNRDQPVDPYLAQLRAAGLAGGL